MKLLFDASSIFNLMVKREPEPLFSQFTLDFTRYELLNVVWKHHVLLNTYNRETLDALLQSSIQILSEMNPIFINGFEKEIMETAIQHRISFYDSAYITRANETKCNLVTEDNKMHKIALELGVESYSIKDV